MVTKSVSGERLKRAKFLKKYPLQKLADEFSVLLNTFQKWQQKKGIPQKKLSLVAHHFGVEEWVFTDENLSTEDFDKIILNPELMKTFRPASNGTSLEKSPSDNDDQLPKPIISFSVKYDPVRGNDYESPRFMIEQSRIVIITKVWGKIESSKTIVQLKKSLDTILEQNDDFPEIEIMADTEKPLPLEQRDEVPIDVAGIYYLKIHSNCNLEVKVYEVTW